MSIGLFGLMRQVVMNHPVYNRLLHHGERISAICVLACKFMKGTVNSKRFLDFLQGTLISEIFLMVRILCQLLCWTIAACDRDFKIDGDPHLIPSSIQPRYEPH